MEVELVLTTLLAYQYFNKAELSYKCTQKNGECISISNNSKMTHRGGKCAGRYRHYILERNVYVMFMALNRLHPCQPGFHP
jgi:hypothetical protein